MGIAAAEIDAWPQAELARYARYAGQYLLPGRRQEYYAAQTAFTVARCLVGYKGGIDDFMLDMQHEPAIQEDDALFDGFSPE